MKWLLMVVLMVSMLAGRAEAAEKRPVEEIDSDSLMLDTQVSPRGAGDNHIALVWWIPNEFWESVFARDETLAEADKKAMFDAISGVTLVAVCQADITPFGAFRFYSKREVEAKMSLTYVDAEGKSTPLVPMDKLDPNLEVVLGAFKPILGAAMGNMGQNMHFYVLKDQANDKSRLVDPYKKGRMDIELSRRDNVQMQTEIEMPLNALFVPRKCPNGKDAHVSWVFCPWTGERLED